MNILFYYPSNKRTISIESVILKFKEQGHRVILLTQSSKSELHDALDLNDVKTYSCFFAKKMSFIYYLKHFFFLVRFCKKHKIDITYSHLQQANIIAVFAQYFCKSKFYICRHHSFVNGYDENFFQTLFDKIINFFSKKIIVPSKIVYKQVCEVEGVNANKVNLIYYGYDFDKYPKPNIQVVEKIRKQYSAKLLLVKVARLVPGKRYDILFDVVKRLVKNEKKDIKLVVISNGPLINEFKSYVNFNKLDDHIFLLGDVSNVIDYLAAADVVPLLSETEASNSVIKEAGLVNKTVIVCKGVGDFEDYIEHNESGYLIDKENPKDELFEILNFLYINKPTSIMGEKLHQNVIETFSIENVISSYENLNNS